MLEAFFFKLFSGPEGVMVALFTRNSDWIENLPAAEVFTEAPDESPHEVMIPIHDHPSSHFKPEFLAERTGPPPAPPANATPGCHGDDVFLDDVIKLISKDLKISKKQARKFSRELFKRLGVHLRAGHRIHSEFVTISEAADGDQPNSWSMEIPEPPAGSPLPIG